jgi:hypothetical protein
MSRGLRRRPKRMTTMMMMGSKTRSERARGQAPFQTCYHAICQDWRPIFLSCRLV